MQRARQVEEYAKLTEDRLAQKQGGDDDGLRPRFHARPWKVEENFSAASGAAVRGACETSLFL